MFITMSQYIQYDQVNVNSQIDIGPTFQACLEVNPQKYKISIQTQLKSITVFTHPICRKNGNDSQLR